MDAQNSNSPPTLLSLGHFDKNSPVSLYAKMGAHWAKRFMDKANELPLLIPLVTDETVLKDKLNELHWSPTPVDNRYRYQLWFEYENSLREQRLMNMANVYNLVGPETTFHAFVMKDARRVIWLLCKPVTYDNAIKDMLNAGLRRLAAALEVDPFKGKKPDLKLLALQIKITQMMDLRQHGAPTQKIQSLSVSATMGADGELKELTEKGDMLAIKQRLHQLELRKRAAEGRGEVIHTGEAALPEPTSGDESPVMDAEVVEEK